jgi:hypothetical protein
LIKGKESIEALILDIMPGREKVKGIHRGYGGGERKIGLEWAGRFSGNRNIFLTCSDYTITP